ncbi:MAG TPA: hypothetical protein VMV97_11125 [Sulfuriferula sp.]|nr:hypothetical protein [Sulfuriferula sp.]
MSTSELYEYIAFYRGEKLKVYAPSSYVAQQKAANMFRAGKVCDVSIFLCKRPDGSQAIHTPALDF